MNAAHFHLIINHFPIIFPIVGAIVMVIGLISKSEDVKRTAFVIFILGALSAIFAVFTGEGAEEVVENITGITEHQIETHENAAKIFAILSYILGGISLGGLVASFKKSKLANVVLIIVLLFSFIVLFFAKNAGTTGGEIRHSEIRNSNSLNEVDTKKEDKADDD